MIVLIDNYDSFTYNIFHYISEFDKKINIYRNDKISIKQIYSYNKDCESDYTINGFDEVMENDYSLLYKASNTKTIGYTEL